MSSNEVRNIRESVDGLLDKNHFNSRVLLIGTNYLSFGQFNKKNQTLTNAETVKLPIKGTQSDFIQFLLETISTNEVLKQKEIPISISFDSSKFTLIPSNYVDVSSEAFLKYVHPLSKKETVKTDIIPDLNLAIVYATLKEIKLALLDYFDQPTFSHSLTSTVSFLFKDNHQDGSQLHLIFNKKQLLILSKSYNKLFSYSQKTFSRATDVLFFVTQCIVEPFKGQIPETITLWGKCREDEEILELLSSYHSGVIRGNFSFQQQDGTNTDPLDFHKHFDLYCLSLYAS